MASDKPATFTASQGAVITTDNVADTSIDAASTDTFTTAATGITASRFATTNAASSDDFALSRGQVHFNEIRQSHCDPTKRELVTDVHSDRLVNMVV